MPTVTRCPLRLCGALSLVAGLATAQATDATTVFTERTARANAFDNPKVLGAVRLGVGWLVSHQEADGHWDVAGFMRHDPATDRCDGPGRGTYDIGVTALALLALLAPADPGKQEACRIAADWLAGQIDATTGRIPDVGHDFIYQQALATAALAEAAALLGRPRYRDAASRCLAYLVEHRNPGAAWRYAAHDGDNDSSVTAWCLVALASCRHLGLDVEADVVGQALAWLDSITDATTGHCGYTKRGDPSARMPGDHGQRFPVELGTSLTAASLHARLVSGTSPNDALVQGAIRHLLERPPTWTPSAIDFVGWLHGSTAAAGLPGSAPARRWEAALQNALVGNQRPKGASRGSWDPIDVWGEVGGRVYATACAVLSLSAPWRLGRMDAVAWIPDAPPFQKVRQHWLGGRLGAAAVELGGIAADAATDRRGRWIRWYLDVEVERAVQQQLALARLLPNPLDREEHLLRTATALVPLAVAEQAKRLVEVMHADPATHDEILASRQLRVVRKIYDEAIDKRDPKKRSQAREMLQELVAKWPYTDAAHAAVALAETLHVR